MAQRGEHPPDQVAVLRALLALTPPYGLAGALRLADLGPGVWPVLARGVASGIELVPAGELASLRLAGPAGVEVDVRRDADGDLLVAPVVRGTGAPVDGSRVALLGVEPHGVVTLEPAGDEPVTWAAELRALDSTPSAFTRALASRGPVRVPARAEALFVDSYLPDLGRATAVGSSDGSVGLPAPLPPVLALLLAWRGPGAVEVRWAWQRGRGEDAPRQALDDPPAVGRSGRADARRVSEDLSEHVRADPVAERLVGAPAEQPPVRTLRGDDVLALVADVLPALAEHPDVVVVDAGTRPEHRASDAVPEIRFEVEDDERGGHQEGEPDGAGRATRARRSTGPVTEDALTDWLDLRVGVEVDGEEVPLPLVLAALTRRDDRLILPSGLHVATDHPAFARLAEAVAGADLVRGADALKVQRALDEAAGAAGGAGDQGDGGDAAGSRLRVSRHDLATWAELGEAGQLEGRAADWAAAARGLRDLTELPALDPGLLATELRPYQVEGARWLAMLWQHGVGGVLADDMGLGKTLQTIAHLAIEKESGRLAPARARRRPDQPRAATGSARSRGSRPTW